MRGRNRPRIRSLEFLQNDLRISKGLVVSPWVKNDRPFLNAVPSCEDNEMKADATWNWSRLLTFNVAQEEHPQASDLA